MNIINNIKNRWLSLSFRIKLLILIFSVNVVILGLSIAIYLFFFSRQVQDFNSNIVTQGVDYLGENINQLAIHIEEISETLVLDPTILNSAIISADRLSLDEQLYNYNYIQELISNNFYNNIPVYSTIYYEDDPIYIGHNYRFLGIDKLEEIGITQEDLSTTDIYWTGLFESESLNIGNEGGYFGGARNLIDYENFGYLGGVVSVYVAEEDVRRLLKSLSASSGACIILVDSNSNIISSTDELQIGKSFSNIYGVDIQQLNNSSEIKLENFSDSYVISKTVETTGWTVVAVAPNNNIFTSGDTSLQLYLTIAVFILIFIILLDIIVSKKLNDRVANVFNRIATADSSADEDSENWEFREDLRKVLLFHKTLYDNNETLTERLLEEELAHKNATLSLLHSQIDSHFLYNSLDSINWMARKHKAEDIVEMVQLLSKFYRLTLAKGREIITVSEELEHTETYLKLQQIRFEGQIEFEIVADADFRTRDILKLTLQPIVENAIIHGLMEKDQPGGKITITATDINDTLTIRILDDGAGMPQDMVDAVNNNDEIVAHKDRVSNGSGFGIRNIKERLKLFYRDQASLVVKSSPCGTEIVIVIDYVQ